MDIASWKSTCRRQGSSNALILSLLGVGPREPDVLMKAQGITGGTTRNLPLRSFTRKVIDLEAVLVTCSTYLLVDITSPSTTSADPHP